MKAAKERDGLLQKWGVYFLWQLWSTGVPKKQFQGNLEHTGDYNHQTLENFSVLGRERIYVRVWRHGSAVSRPAALAEGLNSIPNIYMVAHSHP